MAWNERHGRVSRAFDEWKMTDAEQRAFLRLGLQFASESYDRLWDEAGSEPYDGDTGDEQIDSFERKVDGLHEHEFAWMFTSGVLKDAVTVFEVYLEKAREEVLRVHGGSGEIPERAPFWGALRSFYKKLGVEIETDEVRRIRELRHFLTHRRGELRTDALRREYARDCEEWWAINVPLSRDQLIEAMDALATAVRAIDPVVYRHSWGRVAVESLLSTPDP